MATYRFVQQWEQVDDVEADNVEQARVMARGFSLDPPLAHLVDSVLVGEVDDAGIAHPVGQHRLEIVR